MKKRDANDILREEGPDALRAKFDSNVRPFQPVQAGPNGSTEPVGPIIELIPFNDIRLSTGRRYLVKDIIPRVGVAVVWGPPKCGKSFWTFDLFMHVALDWEYRGRRVHHGPVVYCAFEGQAGFDARVAGFRQHVLDDDDDGSKIPFYLEPVTLALVRDHRALIIAIMRQLGDVKPVAVALDTLNRSIAGSESSDEDMTAYFNAADAIRAAFDCAVVIVHHSGIDGTRPRGHTSLTGGVAAQIAVSRDDNNRVIATVEHMKDGAEGAVVAFRLERVVVGVDVDGDDISSCIVVPIDGEHVITKPKRNLSPKYELAMRNLADLAAEEGLPPPASWNLPNGIRTVSVNDWRTELLSRGVIREDEDRRVFWNMKNRLKTKNLVGERDGQVWSAR